ncbi:MAG TPA: glycoside hydrolase family 32 protein [Bryobacteraceae bacterium]|nr:glycoside hydrolase family 32 protein [Bryobacteraceae bacterium]
MRFLLLLAAMAIASSFSADIPAAYDQPFRPQFHFSPREHWTNDPNGLVYFDGEYHLFFQYNPFGDKWGHMSWGHAVSTDLLHWTELPAALKEENGIMIFTGSAVVDSQNTSRFCIGNKPCLVAVYTGYTPQRGSLPSVQTQNVAYSNDRGRTWTKYSRNPVLDLHMTDFRDPKVFWFEPTRRWIMAVSLPNDHKVRFYSSTNLKNWSFLSDYGLAGAATGQWECPELFELPVEEGGSRWVLKIGLNPGARQGGSGEQYFIGQFDGKQFKNDNPASTTLWTDYGKDCYCALTFNGLPANRPPVMIGWMSNWQYATSLPTSPWRGQMTFPRRLWLSRTRDGIRVFQKPINMIEQLRSVHVDASGRLVAETNSKLKSSNITSNITKQHTFELISTIGFGTAREFGWRILQQNGVVTVVGYDRNKGSLFIDRRHSGLVGFSPQFPSRMDAPLRVSGSLELEILVDRSSVEVFANGGQIAMTSLVFPPAEANAIEAYTRGGNPSTISAVLWGFKSTHD